MHPLGNRRRRTTRAASGRPLRPQPLLAHGLHQRQQGLYTLEEPGQLLAGDAVVFRVARLDIGVLELFEASLGETAIARPDGEEPSVEIDAALVEMAEIVGRRRVEREGEQRAL